MKRLDSALSVKKYAATINMSTTYNTSLSGVSTAKGRRESISGMTRRGFIGCAAGALVGCSSIRDFRPTEASFAETDLGVMIAKEIDNELDIHSYGEGTQEEGLAAKAGVERWLAHMKDNGYVEDYNVLVRPCAENSGGRLFFSSVMVKARGYKATVFDRVVMRNIL